MIEVRNLSLSFGDRDLLREVSFQLGDRQKLCLVGPNGVGKSTLFHLLAGAMQPDSGQVIRSGGLRIGWLRQHAEFPADATALSAALQAFAPLLRKAHDLEMLREELGRRSATDEDLQRLDEWQDALTHEGYYSAEARTRSVLHGLGFSREAQEKPLAQLSGGWGMRVALAQVLLGRPDCLLLDEPTNHLDLESILWLEAYLRNAPGSLLLVCHDRRFVDRVCEGVLDLHQGRIETYPLPFARFEEERALRVAQQRRAAAKAQDEIERLSRFIDRFKAKATKASQARSAMKRLDRIEIQEIDQEGPALRLRFPNADYAGAFAFRAEDLGKSFGGKTVFQDGAFTIRAGDKAALVGPNGAGKTTLMRLLAGELASDGGRLDRGAGIRLGYYAQYVELAKSEMNASILAWMLAAFPQASQGAIRAALGAMLFSGDDVHKPLRVLSGGERARVRLARLLLSPSNTLLLDEPTNHLDLRSQDLLLAALGDYPGTVVFVSHDRDFCGALATRVLRVDGGRITEYPGDYAYYSHKLEEDLARAEAQDEAGERAPKSGPRSSHAERKEAERARRKLERLEAEATARIEALERRNGEIDAALCRTEIFQDPEALRQLGEERAANAADVESLYAELARLEAEKA